MSTAVRTCHALMILALIPSTLALMCYDNMLEPVTCPPEDDRSYHWCTKTIDDDSRTQRGCYKHHKNVMGQKVSSEVRFTSNIFRIGNEFFYYTCSYCKILINFFQVCLKALGWTVCHCGTNLCNNASKWTRTGISTMTETFIITIIISALMI